MTSTYIWKHACIIPFNKIDLKSMIWQSLTKNTLNYLNTCYSIFIIIQSFRWKFEEIYLPMLKLLFGLKKKKNPSIISWLLVIPVTSLLLENHRHGDDLTSNIHIVESVRVRRGRPIPVLLSERHLVIRRYGNQLEWGDVHHDPRGAGLALVLGQREARHLAGVRVSPIPRN